MLTLAKSAVFLLEMVRKIALDIRHLGEILVY